MAGVLEGVKVIEMGHVVALPAASTMLADWGAEVIKLEPLIGEMTRGTKRLGGVDAVLKFDGSEVAFRFQMLNRNKKGLALDLKKESGRDALYKLVREADVFMSNYEASALEGLKLDYATLSKLNPGLIYAILTGFGTVGPDKDQRGLDVSAAWARSGIMDLIGQPGSPPPPQRVGMMDMAAAMQIVAGINGALIHKENTGEGQKLEFSLYHTAVWVLTTDIQSTLVGRPLPKHDRYRAANPLWNTYRTKDDRWLMLVLLRPATPRPWPDFCRAIERPELEKDPRFDTMETREQNCEELIRILDEIFATKNSEEWEKCLREHNCMYGRIQTAVEVITDPQALANDFFAELDHPIAGKLKVITTPVKFRQNPASVRTPAPEVGQHTEEVLLDLGYSWDDIAQLKEQGVIL